MDRLPEDARWYWVDMGFACGAVAATDGRIVWTMPVLRKRWMGGSFDQLVLSARLVLELR
jgi:hypothetical protein